MNTRALPNLPGLMAIFALLSGGLMSCQNTSGTGNIEGVCYGKVLRTEKGIASWYSVRTNRGTRTASGRAFCDHKMTAAHRKLPFGTPVRVTNQRNGKSVVVVITDRGPHIRGRIIDVSVAAAKELGFHGHGLTKVTVEVLERKESKSKAL